MIRLLALALPMMGMMVSRLIMGFVDFAMVSELGTEAQAAISPATIFVFMLQGFGFGLGTGVQTFVSQSLGGGKSGEASAYTWQSLYLSLFIAIVLLPLFINPEPAIRWLGALGQHPTPVQNLEVAYVTIALWSFIPSALCGCLDGFFHGIQKPRIGLISIVISVAINIAGNYAFIYGNWGAPEMGIQGAAVATLIAWCVRAVILGGFYLSIEYHSAFATRTSFAPSRTKMAGLIKIGMPSSVQMFVDIGAWFVFLVLILPPFGETVMAGNNIAVQFMHLSFMPAMGLGLALCSLVGFAIGESKIDDAQALTRAALVVTTIYMFVLGLVFFFGRFALVGLLTDDPQVIAVGASIMICAAVFQLFDAVAIVYTNALRGAGDTRWPAIAMAVCCWGIFVAGGWTISRAFPSWGYIGPWTMCVAYLCALAVALWWRYGSGAWETMKIFESPASTIGATEAAAGGAPVVRSPDGPSQP